MPSLEEFSEVRPETSAPPIHLPTITMFTEDEIDWLLNCFNGVMAIPTTLVFNIQGWIPWASSPIPQGLLGKVEGLTLQQKTEFAQKVCAWQDFDAAKVWLESL